MNIYTQFAHTLGGKMQKYDRFDMIAKKYFDMIKLVYFDMKIKIFDHIKVKY